MTPPYGYHHPPERVLTTRRWPWLAGLLTIVTSLAVAASVLFVSPAHASIVTKSLAVPAYPQRSPNLCWAAGIAMILAYKDTTMCVSGVDQCVIVNRGLPAIGCPDTTATSQQIQGAFSRFGYASSLKFTPATQCGITILTYAESVAQINSSRPWLLSILWTGKTVGHVLMIYGYWSETSSPTTQTLYYVDPGDGLRHSATHAYMTANTTYHAVAVNDNIG